LPLDGGVKARSGRYRQLDEEVCNAETAAEVHAVALLKKAMKKHVIETALCLSNRRPATSSQPYLVSCSGQNAENADNSQPARPPVVPTEVYRFRHWR
jgi:hypothetical protein